jgi:magnesium transporter
MREEAKTAAAESSEESGLSVSLPSDLGVRGPREAAELVAAVPTEVAITALRGILPTQAQAILGYLPEEVRKKLRESAPPELRRQFELELEFPEGSVGRLMEPAIGVFPPEQRIAEVVEGLRELVKSHLITYVFVVDGAGILLGVITMRDLLFCRPEQTLREVMLRDVFTLSAENDLLTAMKLTLNRHYPVYPVVDDGGRLLGLVRGSTLFEEQAFELSAQAGSMVGVEKEERLSTPWKRSFFFRHPWLQLNLVTAFVAAAVVGVFEETIAQVVALAVFLPVLAGQSGNTGCQALAVALRAMTLGELTPDKTSRAILKEGLLGFLNGVFVGITAALGMFIFATWQGNPLAGALALVVLLAMIGSCLVSGIAGAAIPVILQKLGADPATASSIFLTTATDVVSMGLFLWLATILVL